MARQYKKNQIITLKGFTEYIEMFTQLSEKGVDEAAKECFDDSCKIIKTSLDKYVRIAKLPSDLTSKLSEAKWEYGNVYEYSYGWLRSSGLDDFLKVCWLNYGTPRRYTQKGYDRGRINPRAFISNAKRSVKQKLNAKQKAMMKDIVDKMK